MTAPPVAGRAHLAEDRVREALAHLAVVAHRRVQHHLLEALTKIVQGWPKLWANFRALIGIFSQIIGPSLAIWANPVQFSFVGQGVRPRRCPFAG